MLQVCIKIAFLVEPVHGGLRLERGFEVVSSGLQSLTCLVPVDSRFEQFLSRNELDTGEL